LLGISELLAYFIGALNGPAIISCQGLRILSQSVLDCDLHRMSEAVVASLLRLYSDPDTRASAAGCLDVAAAPFTAFSYVHAVNAQGNETEDDVDRRTANGRQAILSMLWSWPGLLYLSDPASSTSPPILKTLVDMLYLRNLRIRVSKRRVHR